MLETGEVDEDYFTPSTSATLDSIFDIKKQDDSKDENDSLKYTPPKPNIIQKTEESKATQCIFACTSLVHEWSNNMYISKGNLGFAIMKNLQNDTQYLVLYDSNKTKISFSVITSKFEFTINEQNYLSYYDSNQKYWSVLLAEDKTKEIINLLKSCGAIIQQSPCANKGPPDPIVKSMKTDNSENLESDTDSSLTKKTKASILNRMANMGQSVLPPRPNFPSKTSDSSDNNESYDYPKIRHKPIKTIAKRNVIEKHVINEQSVVLCKQEQPVEHNSSLHTYGDGQLLPVTGTNIISNTNNRDMDTLLSEQRINCSELRINMNRLTDKIDNMVNKMNNLQLEKCVVGSNLQDEILQKLLTEYENKIKTYEELSKSKPSIVSEIPHTSKVMVDNPEIDILKRKIEKLEASYESKAIEMTELQMEVKSLKDTLLEVTNSANLKENNMTQTIVDLENILKIKDEEILELCSQIKNIPVANVNKEMSDEIKSIMNDAYRAISSLFDNNQMYSGDKIKHLVGFAIKKITIQTLKQL